VPINDDTLDEPNETVNLVLRNPVNATLGTQSTAILTIVDNDGPTTVQFETTTYMASEADGAAVINVVLSAPSGIEVRDGAAESAEFHDC
jgi:hypothetical protein